MIAKKILNKSNSWFHWMDTSDKMRKKVTRTKIEFLTYTETINFFIYVECQTKTVFSMVGKETWILAKLAKICNNIKLNQSCSLKL